MCFCYCACTYVLVDAWPHVIIVTRRLRSRDKWGVLSFVTPVCGWYRHVSMFESSAIATIEFDEYREEIWSLANQPPVTPDCTGRPVGLRRLRARSGLSSRYGRDKWVLIDGQCRTPRRHRWFIKINRGAALRRNDQTNGAEPKTRDKLSGELGGRSIALETTQNCGPVSITILLRCALSPRFNSSHRSTPVCRLTCQRNRQRILFSMHWTMGLAYFWYYV